ncbi:guanine nucleotide-binding protein subunit alpha [Balamuthia mandrillaris]
MLGGGSCFCSGANAEGKELAAARRAKHKEIEAQLAQARLSQHCHFRVLLLGTDQECKAAIFQRVVDAEQNRVLPATDAEAGSGTGDGIHEAILSVDNAFFHFIDISYVRGQRSKWIHQLEDVPVLFFCVSASDYGKVDEYNDNKTRIHFGLEMFQEICETVWFRRAEIVLCLNVELLKEKLGQRDLGIAFPDYEGGDNYEAACKYLKDRFNEKNREPRRQIRTIFVHPTDQDWLELTLKHLRDIIITKILNTYC